jgi:F-type H+-transporting ATPase subunit b
MKINWFTFIAQVINFLILMWLLKRYLYKPILNAIDERENKIVAQLKDAEAKKAEAEKERDKFDQKNKSFDEQKAELMQKVIAEGKAEAEKLNEVAKNEANALKTKLEKGIKEEQLSRNHEIGQRIQREVVAIARKTLTDLSSVGFEDQSMLAFLKKIKGLEAEEKDAFISSLNSGTDSILVQSAFELTTKQQTELQNSVVGLLGRKCQFQFKIAPELISGIELSANGYKLAWNISAYLNELEKNITGTIKDKPSNHSKNA